MLSEGLKTLLTLQKASTPLSHDSGIAVSHMALQLLPDLSGVIQPMAPVLLCAEGLEGGQ